MRVVLNKMWNRDVIARLCVFDWSTSVERAGGVTGIFYWLNPSGRTMALGSAQCLTEMSTRNISWRVKAASAKATNLTTYVCRLSENPGSLNHLGSSGPVRMCTVVTLAWCLFCDFSQKCTIHIVYDALVRPLWWGCRPTERHGNLQHFCEFVARRVFTRLSTTHTFAARSLSPARRGFVSAVKQSQRNNWNTSCLRHIML